MFKRRDDLTNPVEIEQSKRQMIMNALNVILKRGVRGTYLYAHDPLLRTTLNQNYQTLLRRTR